MMPLWSGVLVFRDGPIGKYESHITNNSVEVSFFHKRYSELQISKKGFYCINLNNFLVKLYSF